MSETSDLEELSESQLVAVDDDDLEEETVRKSDPPPRAAFSPVPVPLRVLRKPKALVLPPPPVPKPSPLPPPPKLPVRATPTPKLPPPPRLPSPPRELQKYAEEDDSTCTSVVPVERSLRDPRAEAKRPARSAMRWRSQHAPVLIGAAVGAILFVLVATLASVLGKSPTATASSAGGLVVTVAGPGGRAISSPSIDIDGARRCEASPCRIPDLGEGVALVSVVAPGFVAAAPRAVRVSTGSLAALHVELEPEPLAGEPEPPPAAPLPIAETPSEEPPRMKPRRAATMGLLDLRSDPVAAVVVDGRPLGHTPKLQVAVTPGAHEIVFMHPEMGRRARSVNVGAGARQSVAVRF